MAAIVVAAAFLYALTASCAAPAQIASVEANGSNSAVVTAGGDLWVWGYNYTGQVGGGTKENIMGQLGDRTETNRSRSL